LNTAAVLAAAGVVIVAIIYIVAVNRKGPAPVAEPPRAAVEEAPAPSGVAGDQPLPQEAAPPVSGVGVQKAAETPEKKAEASAPAPPLRPAASEKAPPQKAIEKPAAAPPAPAVQPGAGATEGAEKRHSLQVSATEQAWVKVQIDGSEPFDVLLREGESVSWKAAEDFQVTVGNAGGVDVTYDGKTLPRLGESGQVVHIKLPGELPRARPMPAPVAPKETAPAINLPEPGQQAN
jgi:hypothetical protein